MPDSFEISFEDLLPSVERRFFLDTLQKLEAMARNSVKSAEVEGSVLAYSAGVDSSILAALASKSSEKVTLLTIGRKDTFDVKSVEADPLARRCSFRSIVDTFEIEDIKAAAIQVSKIVRVENLSQFEDCVAFWLLASSAKKIKDARYIFSANGTDELFCGYDRFKRIVDKEGYGEVRREITNALESANKLREQVGLVVAESGLATKEPFLQREFIDFALSIPPELKIFKGNDELRKRIWRCLGRVLEIPETSVVRQKKAMQYGMGVHPVVLSLLKKGKLKIPQKSPLSERH